MEWAKISEWRPYIEYKSDKDEPQQALIFCLAQNNVDFSIKTVVSRCDITCKMQGWCSCGRSDV